MTEHISVKTNSVDLTASQTPLKGRPYNQNVGDVSLESIEHKEEDIFGK